MTEWSRRLERARQAGVCIRCGDPWLGATTCCPTCTGDIASALADARDHRREQGLCQCGGATLPGKRLCPKCGEYVRNRKKPEPKPKSVEAMLPAWMRRVLK